MPRHVGGNAAWSPPTSPLSEAHALMARILVVYIAAGLRRHGLRRRPAAIAAWPSARALTPRHPCGPRATTRHQKAKMARY